MALLDRQAYRVNRSTPIMFSLTAWFTPSIVVTTYGLLGMQSGTTGYALGAKLESNGPLRIGNRV